MDAAPNLFDSFLKKCRTINPVGKIYYSLRHYCPASIRRKFQVRREDLTDKGRKEGISGFMRLKNEEEFVSLAIESHLPFLDELIIVYNNSADQTPKIVKEYEKKYRGKIKVYEYLPYVYPLFSRGHDCLSPLSVHSLVNYSNYAVSKTTYKVAVKIDGDDIAIPSLFQKAANYVRGNGLSSELLAYSAINLVSFDGKVYVDRQYPFKDADHWFFPVTDKTHFIHHLWWENISHVLKRQQWGPLYFHARGLKKDWGADNRGGDRNRARVAKCAPDLRELSCRGQVRAMAWEEFVKKYRLEDVPPPEACGIKISV